MKYNTEYPLTVLMASYNNGEYIVESIESILKQKVNFKYQLVIADDCSTDSTLSIIKEYTDKYDFIFLEKAEKNKGVDSYVVHFWDVYKTINTEYVAIIASDDYWIDEHKLQEQYDILSQNKEFVVVCDSFFFYSYNRPSFHESGEHDVPRFSHAATLFFRNVIDIELFPKILRDDGGLPYVFACYGKAYYRNKLTSFYRSSPTGIYTTSSDTEKHTLGIYMQCVIFGFVLSKREQNIPTFENYLMARYKYNDISFIKNTLNDIKHIKNDENYLDSVYYRVQPEDFYYFNILEEDLLKHQQNIISTINTAQAITRNKMNKKKKNT